MTQQEHLNHIRARCVELLEIAEKITVQHAPHAQAGWKATIAAIDNIGEIRRHYSEKHNTLLCALLDEQKAAIIASWPAELL